MGKRFLAVILSLPLAFAVAMEAKANGPQAKPEKAKPAKEDRWEGVVVLVSKDKSTIRVRKMVSHEEKTVAYDASTSWFSQEHGAKTADKIDASQVGNGDRVICVGTTGKDGVLHATTISKRLTARVS